MHRPAAERYVVLNAALFALAWQLVCRPTCENIVHHHHHHDARGETAAVETRAPTRATPAHRHAGHDERAPAPSHLVAPGRALEHAGGEGHACGADMAFGKQRRAAVCLPALPTCGTAPSPPPGDIAVAGATAYATRAPPPVLTAAVPFLSGVSLLL